MSFPFLGNVHNAPLPPPPMMPGIPMLGGQGFENMHQNFNINANMLMPGMNDAPLEFNMNKNMPPLPSENSNNSDDNSQRRSGDNFEQNSIHTLQQQMNENRGINKKRPHDRDNRRRDRKDHNDDKDRRDRHDRNRPLYKGNKFQDNQSDRSSSSGKDSDNRIPEDIVPDGNLQPGGIASQPDMMYGSMGMGGVYGGGMIGTPMGMVGGMGGMMMDPSMMGMGQYTMMSSQIENSTMSDGNQLNNMQLTNANGVPIGTTNAMPIVGDGMSMSGTNLQMGITNPITGIMGLNNLQMGAVKEPIQLKSCTLLPPYPNSAPPTTRERPPGCRTVFVGGLPENITEEILTEIFERCGQITSLRLSKKNFCHIRFTYEQSVDGAVYLSGYRIRIDNKTDPANCARLHVDYAQARDDKYEWECKQRALQRAARHLERQANLHRPPSPPPIHHYSDHEAAAICEKIKQDENFIQAVQVVITWLERGDCNKKNVNVFYSMIQSTNSHVRRLLNEKTQYDEEIQRVKDEAKQKMQGILSQFSQVEKVFAAASHKKVWDHFTKAQRKNIDMWKKQSSEIRSIQLEDFLQESCGGEEMDCSDTDDMEVNNLRKKKLDGDSLKEENDDLRCQLEAYKNEIDILKSEMQCDIDGKSQEIKHLQDQITLLESQVSQAKRARASESVKLLAMEVKLNAMEKNSSEKNSLDLNKIKDDRDSLSTLEQTEKGDSKEAIRTQGCILDNEAKLIGIISTFLHVHPFGASTDYVWSYVQKMEPQLTPNQVEDLLRKYPTVFIQEMSGVGANIERRWVFNGFNTSH